MKCLVKNKEAFGAQGVAVPGPGKYRKLLRDTMEAMEVSKPAENAREILLDAILDNENAERVIMSNRHFFSSARLAVQDSAIYPKAPTRMVQMAEIFEQDQIELFIGLRNPATFLPEVFRHSPKERLADFMGGVDPMDLRWSDTLMRIRDAAPKVSITVWCNEDAPLIWPVILREMGGMDHGEHVEGAYDLLGEIMAEDGLVRFLSYLEEHPAMTDLQMRRVMMAFLDKFALDEAIEEELDMPGWTDDRVAKMTEAYDEDVFDIARIPDLRVLSP